MKKILVVNNDIDAMSLLQTWLQKKKYKVQFTGDGDNVENIVKDFSPDLLIIDVLQGAVAERLKANDSTKHLPIILMTGYTISNRGFADIPADDLIAKPFNLDLLEKKIYKLMNI